MEATLAALELDGKYHRTRNQHRVYSASESRDGELEKDRAGKPTQSVVEDLDLFFPRPPLVDIEVMSMRASERAKNVAGTSSQEFVNRS
jgi:hypothetical protein